MMFTPQEIIVAFVILIPVAFALGRFSTRITYFHARSEQKLTFPEFIHSRDPR
jgi:hypothetical protein